MGKMEVKMPDDFIVKLTELGNKVDEIIPKVLESGAKIMESSISDNLTSVIGVNTKFPSKSTGQLKSALRTTPARVSANGYYSVKIGFEENRNDGKRNNMIAYIIEYGKVGQPPKPFLKPAINTTKDRCINQMAQEFQREVDKI